MEFSARFISVVAVVLVASVAGCAPTVVSAPTESNATTDSPLKTIDGLYEVTITEDELSAGGVTDPALLAEHAGTYYWTLDNGQWVYEQESDKPLEAAAALGTYTVEGTTYTHYWSDDESDVTSATVTILADESLKFTDIVDGDPDFQIISEVLFGLHPWTRLGDA